MKIPLFLVGCYMNYYLKLKMDRLVKFLYLHPLYYYLHENKGT